MIYVIYLCLSTCTVLTSTRKFILFSIKFIPFFNIYSRADFRWLFVLSTNSIPLLYRHSAVNVFDSSPSSPPPTWFFLAWASCKHHTLTDSEVGHCKRERQTSSKNCVFSDCTIAKVVKFSIVKVVQTPWKTGSKSLTATFLFKFIHASSRTRFSQGSKPYTHWCYFSCAALQQTALVSARKTQRPYVNGWQERPKRYRLDWNQNCFPVVKGPWSDDTETSLWFQGNYELPRHRIEITNRFWGLKSLVRGADFSVLGNLQMNLGRYGILQEHWWWL